MQRRGREFWTKVVDDYEAAAGETHADFAARRGVEKAIFERWRFLRGEHSELAADSKVRLLPVQVAVGHDQQHLLVELGDRLGLRVAAGTDPGYVAALVTALRLC